ncbi:MAG TPA: serine hydrolase domain-containing protein [Vicinamibacterales bacterium]|nr:serine hydrolase domain-containing protein [Vicinamibacterales bacterium]
MRHLPRRGSNRGIPDPAGLRVHLAGAFPRLARRRAGAALLLVLAAAAVPTGLPAREDLQAAFARLAEEARSRAGAPGLSAAVVIGDRLVWSSGFGRASVEHDVPATASTVYRIASISKPIAATAVLQLVERGRVGLDEDIRKYLPFFPDKGGMTITVRHLLTHTSGIRHYRPGEMESTRRYETVAEAAAVFMHDPLLFPPGTRYSYSTYGYNLLAGIVEAASGLTFETYLRERIFGPAGMSATWLEHAGEIVPNRACQYVRSDGRLRHAPYADLSVKWAGGGMIATVEDLARFHIALDQGRLLGREMLQLMYTPGRLADGSPIEYGLGWRLEPDKQGRVWVAHSGGATGGSGYLLRLPAQGLAVAVLCNVQGAGNLRELAQAMAERALAAAAASDGPARDRRSRP